jgi:poly-gamma-glutamate capsule biosynthesis protein CapA/YwtB (metallophosphatase superfamily)
MDYGPDGLTDTLNSLDRNGIGHAGAGAGIKDARRPACAEVKGSMICLLAYSLTHPEEFYADEEKAGTAFGHLKFLEQDIPAARKKSDILIVSFHWGTELKDTPNDYQMELGRRAVELGASVVAGHHPHIPQGVETRNGGVIFYSLGNFIFGSYSKYSLRNMIARVRFAGKAVSRIELVPIYTFNEEVVFRPRIMRGGEAKSFCEGIAGLSAPFGTMVEYSPAGCVVSTGGK